MSADDTDLATLGAALKPKVLRELAGERSFERGVTYFHWGAVLSLRRRTSGIEAKVQGNETYRVRLWIDDDQFGYGCNCPVGQAGNFCKHCVAVGLACASGEAVVDDGGEKELRDYLLSLDKEALAALLIEQADRDDRLHSRLTLRAAQAQDLPAAKMAWKEAFCTAVEQPTGYVQYREAEGYALGIDSVIDTLEDFLEAKPEAVIELAEYGLDELEEVLEHVDDSDGWMGGLMERLQDLHLQACKRVQPDPVDLAERLFEREMTADYDVFYGALRSYAEVLGKTGLEAYRRLAEQEWASLPAREPAAYDWQAAGRRFRITSIMEALAEADEDFDALVAIKSRDLSAPYDYLQVAELHRDANKPELALEWAERGWKAFPPDRQDDRLRCFLAAAYSTCGRHDDALALEWPAFEADPHLHNYLRLAERAKAAGQWSAWREKALALIRRRIADERPQTEGGGGWRRHVFADHSLLVEIFLQEGDEEAAWEEARAGGCKTVLWLTLAERRKVSNPADAAEVYRRHVAGILRHTGDSTYQEAVKYIGKIEELHLDLDEEEAFHEFLNEVRAMHHRKRKLMKMLSDSGW